MTRVSVAMATYRGVSFLESQLSSILTQTRPVDEIVITDDSPDSASLDLASRLLAGHPAIILIEQNPERLGVARNFETALRRCTGDVIFLADQDDQWKPTKVQLLLDALEARPDVDAVFSDADIMSGDSRNEDVSLWDAVGFTRHRVTYDQDPVGVLLRKRVVTGATMAIRRRCLDFLLPVTPNGLHDEWFALLLGATGRLAAVDVRPMLYRVHDENVAGVTPPSLRGQLRERRADRSGYQRNARFHADALERLGDRIDDDVRLRLQEKVDFCEFRANLPRRSTARAAAVLRMVIDRSYRRNTETWMSAVFDLAYGGRR